MCPRVWSLSSCLVQQGRHKPSTLWARLLNLTMEFPGLVRGGQGGGSASQGGTTPAMPCFLLLPLLPITLCPAHSHTSSPREPRLEGRNPRHRTLCRVSSGQAPGDSRAFRTRSDGDRAPAPVPTVTQQSPSDAWGQSHRPRSHCLTPLYRKAVSLHSQSTHLNHQAPC